MKKTLILALLAFMPALPALRAQTADAPPVNVNSVLTTLKQVQQKQQADIRSTENSLAQTLMGLSSNATDAVAYYENAVFAVQFNGLNHEAKEIQDWKKQHEAALRDPNFRQALCLHLMYLSLTISHDSGVKTKDLLPTLLTYIQQVETNETGLAGQEELMETPLAKSVIVRSLQIDQYVGDNATWEAIPIKVDNMYTKIILPEYRVEKNATGIFQYWDERIQREEAEVDNSRRPLEIDKFNKVTKPALQWQRAEEYVGLGLKNTAINTMVGIIQANPYHPETPDWIAEVEKMVKELPQAAPPPQPAAAGTGATTPMVANPANTQPGPN